MAKQITKDDLDEKDTEDKDDEDDEDESSEAPTNERKRVAAVRSGGGGGADVGIVPGEPASVASFFGNTFTIFGREFRAYFDSLIAYVVIGVTMLVVGGWLFLWKNQFWAEDKANLNHMFEALPWMLSIIVIPAVTMRALAEEKRSGTLELLITMPIRDSEVILGKFLGALGMISVLLVASMLYPIMLFKAPWALGPLDWYPVWSGYLGLFLMSAAGVAVGLLYSSLTDNQIVAFFLTAFTLVLLMAMGFLAEAVRGTVGDVLAFVSFLTRFAYFPRGVIDTRAVVYFVSIAILCLLIAFRALESRKWK